MNIRILQLVRLHLAAILAALLVPALYFLYGQYISSYSQTQPEKWASDAAGFLKLTAPIIYGVGWGLRLILDRLGRRSRIDTLMAAAALGALATLVVLAWLHLQQDMPLDVADVTLPLICMAMFVLPATLFVLIAGPQTPTSSAAPGRTPAAARRSRPPSPRP